MKWAVTFQAFITEQIEFKLRELKNLENVSADPDQTFQELCCVNCVNYNAIYCVLENCSSDERGWCRGNIFSIRGSNKKWYD